MTENISYTGVLLRSSSRLAPETALELRLQVAVGPQHSRTTEIRCKGAVVRVEQRHALEAPVALAVKIRDYRIVRRDIFKGGPLGMSGGTDPAARGGRVTH